MRAKQVAVWVAWSATVAAGIAGFAAYVDGYVRYRGFPPPEHPAALRDPGTGVRVPAPLGRIVKIDFTSRAVGSQDQPFYVFLPPGYDQTTSMRYPVMYFMHGLGSDPKTIYNVAGTGAKEESLLALHKIHPMIIVAPSGAGFAFHTDTEWVDGVRKDSQWETFVARDLVHAVDARFRTIPFPRGRGIGGLSEGGYAAANIGIHHPDVFGFVESWSGYMTADTTQTRVFDHDRQLIQYNTPMLQVRLRAAELRRAGTYFWFYVGNEDKYSNDNQRFAHLLTELGIPHTYFSTVGKHTWVLWRKYSTDALLAASAHLAIS